MINDMETTAIFLGTMSLLLMVHQVLGEYRNRKTIKELTELNAKQMAFINEQSDEIREITVFSLRCVIKDALEREDYETAHKCKDLIDKYDEADSSIPGRG
jgi:hypothetical protein